MTATVEKWEGSEKLRPLLVPVETLSTHPENPRRGDVERIAASLRRFGQTKPIVVQEGSGAIVAGNHTYRAALEVGWSHIAVVPTEMDDDEARAYLIADNRTSDLGGYDDEALSAALNRLMDSGKLEGTGYTADEVDDEIARIARIAETEPEPFLGGHSEDEATLAAREAARAAAPILREVVLMYDPETYARFGTFVKILQKEWGTNGSIETVYRAVENEAKRVNREGGDGAQ
jgi:ParB-like chromosome segregation protein Spo0J